MWRVCGKDHGQRSREGSACSRDGSGDTVRRASLCPTQASRTARAKASYLTGFLESECLAMLASIISNFYLPYIILSKSVLFTNFPIPELPFLSTKPQHPFLSPSFP